MIKRGKLKSHWTFPGTFVIIKSMTRENLSNREVAEIFQTSADLLEIKGEVVYKVLAYRKAAESLEVLGRDIYDIWKAGQLSDIPGVGKAISEKIDELLS